MEFKLSPIQAKIAFRGNVAPTIDRSLDVLRLTVLGLLLTVGLSVGLPIGFEVGGWAEFSRACSAGLGCRSCWLARSELNGSGSGSGKLADEAVGI
jgi:hypothetical protein